MYFYPDTVEDDFKLFLIGACSALFDIAHKFSTVIGPFDEVPADFEQELQVVTLDKFKMGFKQVGTTTMVFTGSANTPDSVMINHLNTFVQAFSFFNGSFEDLGRYVEKEGIDYRKEVSRRCSELIPLIMEKEDPLNSFLPLPYTQLPKNSNRFFLSASQLLHSVCQDPYNLGGTVFYDSTILCSNLDLDTTRWILLRLKFMNSTVSEDDKGKSRESGSESDAPNENFLLVFMKKEAIAELRESYTGRANDGEKGMQNSSSEDQSLSSSSSSTTEINEIYREPKEDGEYIGLYVCSKDHLALAVVMTIEGIHDVRHIRKLRLDTKTKMSKLEEQLEKAFQESDCEYYTHNGMAVPSSQKGAFQFSRPTYNFLSYVCERGGGGWESGRGLTGC
eukprot:TRINITY_DN872_c0_g1_i4.p1 TRINITY_DN872_c0_g1~~TRINITY_DN872_c0_g1_i4.p1  ORF type:complete len:392 (-),score=102.69 TRINITY_DN872_c0_g1_i4:1078-2253(-)